MMRIMVAATQDCEVRHLEGVGGSRASLQCTSHGVAHVEVRLRHVRRQIQLLAKTYKTIIFVPENIRSMFSSIFF